MKNIFLKKCIFIAIAVWGTTFAYAGIVTFTFIYESGIESVGYNKINNGNTQLTSITTMASTSQLDVNVSGTFSSMEWEANIFNNTYPLNDRLGLDTKNSAAAATDIYMSGTFDINGKPVASDLALAHEHKSHDWWIATNSGANYQNLGLDVTDGTNHYCLAEIYGNNYEVDVKPGTCDNLIKYDWSGARTETMTFKYGSGIESVAFEYNGTHDALHNGYDYLEQVYTSTETNSLDVHIEAKINNLSNIANSYNQLFNSEHSINYQAKKPSPSTLAWWVQGDLVVNGEPVATDFTIAQHNDTSNDWYSGTLNGTTLDNNQITVSAINNGSDVYCLNGTNKNTITVEVGACAPDKDTKQDLYFIYESGISSVEFRYNGRNDTNGNLYNITPESDSAGIDIVVSEHASLSKQVTTSYEENFSKGHSMNIDTITTYDEVPTKMKYWAQGTLIINGHEVALDFTITSKQYERVIGSRYGLAGSLFNTYGKNIYPQNYMDFTAQDNSNLHYCLLTLSQIEDPIMTRPFRDDEDTIWVYSGTCSSVGYIY